VVETNAAVSDNGEKNHDSDPPNVHFDRDNLRDNDDE
jgi:hypothetical protein